MKNGFEIKKVIKYSSIFDDEKKSLDYYLTGIKRSELIRATTYFLGFSIDNSKYDKIKNFLEFFFCKENNLLANKIYEKLIKSGQIIINPLTALQLFEYSFDHLNEEETQEKEQAEVNIFKAILLQNEKNLEAQNNAFSSTEQVNDKIKYAATVLTQSFGYSDLINFNKHELFVTQLIKSIYLFEFLESHCSLPLKQDSLKLDKILILSSQKTVMKKSRFTESQIVKILKEYESGIDTQSLCREYGISRATFYNWRKKYSGMEVSQLKRLKELEEENRKLKQMYAEASLDNKMLKDLLGKKF